FFSCFLLLEWSSHCKVEDDSLFSSLPVQVESKLQPDRTHRGIPSYAEAGRGPQGLDESVQVVEPFAVVEEYITLQACRLPYIENPLGVKIELARCAYGVSRNGV